MNKELLEMLAKIESKKKEARELIAQDKVEEAKVLRDEVLAMQNKFDVAKDLFVQEKGEILKQEPEPEPKDSYTKQFLNGVRNRFENSMTEGTAGDGGYTVPQDISTAINELRQSKDALQNLIAVESVSTLSGSRVFKSRSQQAGFTEVLESGAIAEKATPKFTNLPYSVKKYAGFFKVTSELLEDSDQAITSTLTKWIGDESRVTRNKLILAELGKKAKTAIAKIDDIKDTLNVTLDPAFRYTSNIVTNQDGFNYLDKLKDTDGDYLLQPSVS